VSWLCLALDVQVHSQSQAAKRPAPSLHMQHICALARLRMLTLHPLLPPLLSLRAFRLQSPRFVRCTNCHAVSSAGSELVRASEVEEGTAATTTQPVRSARAPRKRRAKESGVLHDATGQDAAKLEVPGPKQAPDLHCGVPRTSATDWRAVKRWCGPKKTVAVRCYLSHGPRTPTARGSLGTQYLQQPLRNALVLTSCPAEPRQYHSQQSITMQCYRFMHCATRRLRRAMTLPA